MSAYNYICGTSTITYSKGYIALHLDNFDIPETFEIADETLLRKTNFHVSLLCVKNILEIKPELEAEVLQHFCTFIEDNEMKFEGFTNEFRLAEYEKRKSIVALCNVSNLHMFAKYLTEKIGMSVAAQPAHVTLYTLQPDAGIGLNSKEDMERKSSLIEVPEAIVSTLMRYKKIITAVGSND